MEPSDKLEAGAGIIEESDNNSSMALSVTVTAHFSQIVGAPPVFRVYTMLGVPSPVVGAEVCAIASRHLRAMAADLASQATQVPDPGLLSALAARRRP